MKLLESLVIRGRARARARLNRGDRPARLDIRLDDLDAPGVVPDGALDLDGWQARIVEVVQWAGAMPVRIVSRADHELLPDIIRFCHRLEMPTSLRTNARGLDRRKAEELVDRGLGECILRVAGLDDQIQGEILGDSASEADVAIGALVLARHSRVAQIGVVVEIPFDARTARGVRSLIAWARGKGADAVTLASPFRGSPTDAYMNEAIEVYEDESAPFRRTNRAVLARIERLDGVGAPRPGGRCPVSSRLELLPDGSARSCPFKAGRGEGAIAEAWAALAGQRGEIANCDRSCGHPELA